MIETIALRIAEVGDAGAIARIIGTGVAPLQRSAMIYGCAGIEAFVRAELELPTELSERLFLVAERDGDIAGAMELRWTGGELFLNQIAVADFARGHGLGNAMLRAAVHMVGARRWQRMLLDVFTDNAVAVGWYERLGFTEISRADWWTMPLTGGVPPEGFAVLNWAQASLVQRVYGFSQLEIVLRDRHYTVGQLGDTFFRVTSLQAAEDEELLAGLRRLAPERQLLALLPSGELPASIAATSSLLCRTRRMACPLPLLLEKLG